MSIRPLVASDVSAVASLHVKGIETGFISSLGKDFVAAVYRAVIRSEGSFGFVAIDDGSVLGFVCFTASVGRLYRTVLRASGLRLAWLLAGRIFSFRVIKKLFETLFYPSRTKKLNLPAPELLSIAVASQGRGRGVAGQLIQEGFAKCVKMGIDKVKVMVGADNEVANRLYVKSDFRLAAQIDSHGVKSNVYVINLTQ